MNNKDEKKDFVSGMGRRQEHYRKARTGLKLGCAAMGAIVVVMAAMFVRATPATATSEPEQTATVFETIVSKVKEVGGTDKEKEVKPDDLDDQEDMAEGAKTIKSYPVEPDTEEGSITQIVTRTYRLPETYVPAGLTEPDVRFTIDYEDDRKLMRRAAADALEQLFEGAGADGYQLIAVSGYRSYARQEVIYNNNVAMYGEEKANSVSALPGSSEHQTGLTMDISCDANQRDLTQAFGDLPEGQWVADHCYEYGFIIRYPKGKESITGYIYEPWHLRYVGVELATFLNDEGITLDEYYGVTAVGSEWEMTIDEIEDERGEAARTEQSLTVTPGASSVQSTPAATAWPTPTPTAWPTPTPTAAPTPAPTPAATPTPTPAPTDAPESSEVTETEEADSSSEETVSEVSETEETEASEVYELEETTEDLKDEPAADESTDSEEAAGSAETETEADYDELTEEDLEELSDGEGWQDSVKVYDEEGNEVNLTDEEMQELIENVDVTGIMEDTDND